MRALALVLALAILAVIVACARSDSRTSDRDRIEAIKKLARSTVAQRGVPGIAIAVVRDGQLFDKLVLGSADLAAHQPVTSATPFQLASTTKLFSSTAVLLLVADGKLKLDDQVGAHLGGLPAAWRPVTIRQLLSHTSGLPDITSGTGDVDLIASDWDQARPIIAGKPLQFRPGTGWAYNQTNYALLLRLIEKVSGLKFEDFMAQRLFAPLGMANTFFPDARHHCAVNYKQEQDGRIAERSDLVFPHYVHAAGGLCSSLDDLIAWSRAVNSGKIVPREILAQAQTPTKLADGSNATIAGSLSYGLGRAIETSAHHRWAGHSGGNSTAIRQYLDDKLTIIVLHNGHSDPDAIVASVARAMLESAGGTAGSQADLWDSAGTGDVSAIESAIRAGADVNALDTRSSRNGRYALNWAAIGNHADAVRLLVADGARVNARNLTGFDALHHAAESGSTDAAKALLDAGADPSLRNSAGESAADVARRKGHDELAALMDAARAKAH